MYLCIKMLPSTNDWHKTRFFKVAKKIILVAFDVKLDKQIAALSTNYLV